jgi:hypothetical protein
MRVIIPAVVIVLLAATIAFLFASPPEAAAQRYFEATYDYRAHRDVRVEVLDRGLNHAKVRLLARFEIDPDYGGWDNAPPWFEYANELELVRYGMRWIPARGYLVEGDRTTGVFNSYWVATDPERERQRAAPGLCPCTRYLSGTEQLQEGSLPGW